jgi:aminoglycoside phosphotransferase (APT) family kinase protein
VRSGQEIEAALTPLAPLFEAPVLDRIAAVVGRLVADLRADPRLQFSHGDFQPKNLLVEADGRLAAVLDWEKAALATPWEDLATLLRYAPDDAAEAAFGEGAAAAGAGCDWRWHCRATDVAAIGLQLAQTGAPEPDAALWARMLSALVLALEGSPEPARSAARALP